MGLPSKETKEIMVTGEYTTENRGNFIAVIDPTGALVGLVRKDKSYRIDRMVKTIRNKFKYKY